MVNYQEIKIQSSFDCYDLQLHVVFKEYRLAGPKVGTIGIDSGLTGRNPESVGKRLHDFSAMKNRQIE